MKTSMKLDVVSANDMAYEQSANKVRRVKSRKSANNGQAKEVSSELGGSWSESNWGAEIKTQVDDVTTTANVFKKDNGQYGYRVRVDSSGVGSHTDMETPQACVENVLVGIESIVKACSELSRDAFLKTQEQTEASDAEDSVQKQLDNDREASQAAAAEITEED